MGNVCSFIREGIDYVFRYILPRYASYFPGAYYNRIEGNFLLPNDIEDVRETDKLLTNDEDHTISIEQDPNCDRNNRKAAGNAGLLRGIVSDFFDNYNFQVEVLNGKNAAENVKRKGKHVKPFHSEQTDKSWKYLNRYEALNRSKSEQQQWNIRKDLISGAKDIEVNGPDSSSKGHEYANCSSFNVQDDNAGGNNAKQPTYDTENLKTGPSNTEFNVKSNESHTNNRRRKYGVAPTESILRHREQLVENISRISGPENPEKLNDENVSDDCSNDRQGCEVTGDKVRKVSLLRMHSGCHYSVDEGNESVELDDYSKDSPTLQVDVETFRNVSHPNLGSGGVVVFEELSKHLSLPDYYAENPIVYNELPKGVELPKTSPMNLPPQQPLLRPASFSGGGIVPTNTRRVSLPLIYPQTHPLLHTVTAEGSTRNSNFGGLVRSDKDCQKIFSDLMSQSLKFDLLVPISGWSVGEDLSENRREMPRRASESDSSTTGNSTCDGDMDKKMHLGSF